MEGEAWNLIALFNPFKNKTKNTGVENESSPEEQKKHFEEQGPSLKQSKLDFCLPKVFDSLCEGIFLIFLSLVYFLLQQNHIISHSKEILFPMAQMYQNLLFCSSLLHDYLG